MRYGLTTDALKKIVGIFEKNPQVKEVILYGSRTMGNYHAGSDIDLAVKGEDMDMSDLLRIGAQLDELDLPYYFDLLLFEKIQNKDMIDHICRVGELIYMVPST